ncbi:hypothetical protein PFISCL1PPCAC_7506, partial [Pristionchus fissidentatus]
MDNNDSGPFLYIQMQMCKYSLRDWLYRNFEDRRMKAWMKRLLEAVAYIHGKNLFHRDLKPSNILFDGEDVLKICDLGIAAAFETRDDGKEATISRTDGMGSPLYMSPEQFERYSSKVDVFALGIRLIFAEISVRMNDTERREVNIYNCENKNCKRSQSDESRAEFIKWLTTVDPDKRPSCRQALDSPFFT